MLTWRDPDDCPVAVPTSPRAPDGHPAEVAGADTGAETAFRNTGWQITEPCESTGLTSNVSVLPAPPWPLAGLMPLAEAVPCWFANTVLLLVMQGNGAGGQAKP